MFKQYMRDDLIAKAFLKHTESGLITDHDASLIKAYVHEKAAADRISLARQDKITYTLLLWRRFIHVEYSKLSMPDIWDALREMPDSTKFRGDKKPSQNTVHDYIRVLKPFLFWLVENEIVVLPERKIKAIRAPGVDQDTKGPDDILTYEEVLKIIEGATSHRDKAFLMTLYESGGRVGEIASLKWKDVRFEDQKGVGLYIPNIKTKESTGIKRRYVRLTLSQSYLATWKNDYPHYGNKAAGDNLVFVNHAGDFMEYPTIRKLIQRAVKHAGITKRVYPHLFRDSRITHMVAQGYNESIIKQMMWGNVSTDMFRTYVQLSENDIDNELWSKAGVKIEKKPEHVPIKPRVCGCCHSINPPTMEFCPHCGFGLSEEALSRTETVKNFINIKEMTNILTGREGYIPGQENSENENLVTVSLTKEEREVLAKVLPGLLGTST